MKRSPLRRKKPLLARRRNIGYGNGKGHLSGGGQHLPKRSMRKRRAAATKEEHAHMSKVASLGCIVCRRMGIRRAAAVHHIRTGYGRGQRASHWETLPLCPDHHQDGGFGVAFHAGPRTWMAKFGTEIALLFEVYTLIGATFDDLLVWRKSTPRWWPRFLDGSALISNAAEIFNQEEVHEEVWEIG